MTQSPLFFVLSAIVPQVIVATSKIQLPTETNALALNLTKPKSSTRLGAYELSVLDGAAAHMVINRCPYIRQLPSADNKSAFETRLLFFCLLGSSWSTRCTIMTVSLSVK